MMTRSTKVSLSERREDERIGDVIALSEEGRMRG